MVDYPTDAFKGVDFVVERERLLSTNNEQQHLTGLNATSEGTMAMMSPWLHSAIDGLARWDAQHFIHIARFGYSWESQLAFLPGWPVVLRVAGRVVNWVVPLWAVDSATAMLLGELDLWQSAKIE